MKDALGNEVDDPVIGNPEATVEPGTPPPTVDDGGIEVVVESTVEEPPPGEPPAATPPVPVVDPVSLKNKVFAQDRIINNMRRSFEEVSRQLNETTKTIEQLRKEREEGLFGRKEEGAAEDDVDKLVKEGKWKDGVKLMITRTIAKATDTQRQEIAVARQAEETKITQQKNIVDVSDRHPELEDPSSEKRIVFDTILAENPRWRLSPDGPLLAMYKMEERMNLGHAVKAPGQPPVPLKPGVPVGNANLPPSRPPAPVSKVTLTGEQKSFCDDNGIPYEDYAKSLGFVSRGEGKVGIVP